MKFCITCKKTLPLNNFYFSGNRYRSPCKKCCQNKRRSLDGVIKQRWAGIIGRVKGRTNHYTTAFNKEYCGKGEFFKWAYHSKKLLELYYNWKKHNFRRDLSPSVDRIDIDGGYIFDNMQWLTMKENNKKGHRDHNYSYGRKRVILTKGGKQMIFNSGKEASLYFGKNRLAVTNNIIMGHKLLGWKCEWL